MLSKILLVISAVLGLSACSTNYELQQPASETIYLTPDTLPRPLPPKLEAYDVRYGMDHPINFKRFQTNTLKLVNHIQRLTDTIVTYESQIIRMKLTAQEETKK